MLPSSSFLEHISIPKADANNLWQKLHNQTEWVSNSSKHSSSLLYSLCVCGRMGIISNVQCIFYIYLIWIFWIWGYYHQRRYTGTWWVTLKAGYLWRRMTSFICRWCIVIWTPRLGIYILHTDASVKCCVSKCEWEVTTITTSGWRICWRFTWCCPNCQESW